MIHCYWNISLVLAYSSPSIVKRSIIPLFDCLFLNYIGFLQIFYFPSRSYYLPLGLSSKSAKFHLEPFLSNYTVNARSGIAWTYLLLEIPQGAAGSNLHVQLVSDPTVDYEVYTKFGGIPSDDNWDHYANNTSGGNGSMILMSSNNEHMIDFYILYVREGPWGLGIKKNNSHHELQTMMSITLESCPRSCSSHGSCRSSVDETGFSSYRLLICHHSLLKLCSCHNAFESII